MITLAAFLPGSKRKGRLMQNDILTIEYQQVLRYNSDQRGWSEALDISVRLHAEALTSGWLRDQFTGRSGPLEFMVLMTITLHTQPLTGKMLQQLLRLGIARPADEGRMFSMVTDLGLGEELGVNRHTVDEVTRRLADRQLLDIWTLPASLRNQGRFANTKIYVLSGTVQQAFVKEITPKPHLVGEAEAHRGRFTATVESGLGHRGRSAATVEPEIAHRGGSTATVKPPLAPHRGRSGAPNAADPATNVVVDVVVDQDQELDAVFSDDAVFAHFAARQGRPSSPTGRDRQAVSELREAGYSLAEILAGIDLAFDRGDQPKRFAYCARIVQDTPPARLLARPLATLEPPAESDQSLSPLAIPADLTAAVEVYQSAGKDLRPAVVARLRLLADECDAAARQHASTGPDWLVQSLQRGLGVADDLLLYAQGVLRNWITSGPTRAHIAPRPAPSNNAAPASPPKRDWDSE